MIKKILSHPLVGHVQTMDEYKKAISTPEFAQGMALIALGEKQMGASWRETLKTVAAEGMYAGFDTDTQGVAFLFKSKDEAQLKKLASIMINLASENGNKKNFKRMDFREAKVATLDDTIVARFKSWFLISNKKDLAKSIVNNLHDGAEVNLAKANWFKSAAKKKNTNSDIWSVVDLKTIRSTGIAKELFTGKTDNPFAELVLGGILDALHHAPFATADLSINQNLAFSTSLPFDSSWSHEARSFFYGSGDDKGIAPRTLNPENVIANLVSYRDIGDWWLSKEELFEENVIAQLAQAESQLTTIFSGMDFGQEVLGSLKPGAQIVVAQNKFQKEYQPDIKLPAFALVGKLKDPEKIQRRLKIAFQSVIGFANINLGMTGQPQLDLETEKIGDAKVSSATYVFDDETEKGLLLFNFAPTIAFQGEHLVISSNRELAIELAELAARPGSSQNEATNTRLDISGEQLRKILNANREALIANNMIEKGSSRKESAAEMDILFTAMKFLGDSQLDFKVLEDQMKLDLKIEIANPNSAVTK